MSSTFWNDLKRALNNGAAIVAEKSEEYIKIGKLKTEILRLERKLQKLYSELGKKTYTLLSQKKSGNDISADKKINSSLKDIKDTQSQIKSKKKEVEEIKISTSSDEDSSEKPQETKPRPSRKKTAQNIKVKSKEKGK